MRAVLGVVVLVTGLYFVGLSFVEVNDLVNEDGGQLIGLIAQLGSGIRLLSYTGGGMILAAAGFFLLNRKSA